MLVSLFVMIRSVVAQEYKLQIRTPRSFIQLLLYCTLDRDLTGTRKTAWTTAEVIVPERVSVLSLCLGKRPRVCV